MWSSWNQALQARCFVRASAVALTMMSLKETLPRSPSCRLRASRASAARSMSTSLVRKKWGTGPSDVTRRLAIVLRICVSGTSSNGVPVTAGCGMRDAGCGAAATAAGVAAWGRAAVASRSRLTTRPPGPEPVTSLRSTPASFAIRLASGEAFTRVASAAAATGSGVTATGAGAVTVATFPVSRFPLPEGVAGAAAAGTAPTASRRDDHRHHAPDRHGLALGGGDLPQHAVRARHQIHHGLVGLDLGQCLARLHRVPVPLVPLHHAPLLHGRGERFHIDIGGHRRQSR